MKTKSDRPSDEAMEVVFSGMSGRFPLSDSVDEFWDNLVNKVNMVSGINDRLPQSEDSFPASMAVLKDIGLFDAAFFGINHTAADAMGSAQRILYEVVFEAIMDAGYNPEALRGTKTGVYVGSCASDREASTSNDKDAKGTLTWGSYRLPNTVSFHFDLKGPSLAMDSACSTSLSALTVALADLRRGACDRAIVATSQISTNVHEFQWFNDMKTVSRSGVSRIFDADSDGFVPGEAVVAILLESKSVAKRSYGDLVSSVIGHDGFKGEGLTFPSREAQKEMLWDCYAKANLKLNDIAFFECHGTGTRAGDMVEGNAVGEALTVDRPDPLLIGSVKSNCGHNLGSATLSSVIKVLLMSQRRLIPPNLNYENPNPNVPHLSDGRLKVVLDTMPFNGGIVGINAFGIGGTNGHIIVNCPLDNSANFHGKVLELTNIPRLVPVCGRNEESLNYVVDFIKSKYNSGELTEDFLALLSGFTKASPGGGLNSRAVLKLEKGEEIAKVVGNANKKRPVWLIMSGMGAQWPAMAKDLMRFDVFATTINKCHQVVSSLGIDLLHSITSEDATVLNAETSLVAIASIQAALIDLIKLLEIHYDGLIGFSMGELACAYFEDCITLEEYMRAAFWRSQCVVDCKNLEPGLMAAVGLSPEEATKRCPEGIRVACHISDEMVTIAGRKDIMLPFMEELKKEDFFVREVDSGNVANHHREYLAEPSIKLREVMESLIAAPKDRSAKWISSSVVEEQWSDDIGKYASSEYFVNNFVSPVLFNEALKKCPKDAIVIEIGPHSTMRGTVMKTLGKNVQYSCLMARNTPSSFDKLFDELARLYTLGVNLCYEKLYPSFNFPVALTTPSLAPLFQWDHSQKWNYHCYPEYFNHQTAGEFVARVDLNNFGDAYLSGHTIDGRVLYPAAGYLKLAWDTLARGIGSPSEKIPVAIEDVVFSRATVLSTHRISRLTCRVNSIDGHFTIAADGEVCCTGVIRALEETNSNSITNTTFEAINKSLSKTDAASMTGKEFYRELRVRGYHYKDQFKGVESVSLDGSSALIRWTAHSNWITFIDCCFQFPILCLGEDRRLRVPTRLGRLTLDPVNFKPVDGGLVKVIFDRRLFVTSSSGVLIERLEANPIFRNPFPRVVSETVRFTPYFSTDRIEHSEITQNEESVAKFSFVGNEDLIRPLIEIIAENSFSRQLTMMDLTTEKLGEQISNGLGDALLTVNSVEDADCHVLLIEIGKREVVAQGVAEKISKHLVKKGFLLTITLNEDDSELDLTDQMEVSKIVDTENLIAVSERSSTRATLRMYRKPDAVNFNNDNLIMTSTKNFTWVEGAKKAFSENADNVWFITNHQINGLTGFVNCLRREPNGQRVRCLMVLGDHEDEDFEMEVDFESEEIKEIITADLVMNVVRGKQVGRFCRFPVKDSVLQESSQAVIGIGTRGDLSSLHWRESQDVNACIQKPGDVIDVHYIAINFRDVMLALGRLPSEEACQNCLGREYSGVDQSGKRLMGFIFKNGMPTAIVPDGITYSWEVPEKWTLEEAATVPIVYTTVVYGLLIRGQLEKGESILIHAGAGGVGQAAIRIAQSLNCKVYTTVGSQEKRDFLKSTFGLSDNQIFNSRDINFETEIKRLTNGRGVDMVLNSLADEKLIASVRCLAISGRFIEIGKADILNNSKLGMALIGKNISLQIIDLEQKLSDKVLQHVSELLTSMMKNGTIKPLVRTVFKNDELEDAFRFMTASKHIGKVLVKVRDEVDENWTLAIKRSTLFCPEKSYVIIGGLGGFGLELLHWMVLRGARKLVVTSRSGLTEAYQDYVINRARDAGCKVLIKTHDISTLAGARKVIDAASDLAPIGGVFNLALVLRDAIFENQTAEQFEEVCAAKVNGTLNMDKLTRDDIVLLDHFVCFSSISSGLGNPGQTNYGFANSVMERVCEQRKKDGLSGLAIQWGVVGDVGVLADNDVSIKDFAPQKIMSCLETLDKLLNCGEAIAGSHVMATNEGLLNKINSSDPFESIAHVLGARNAAEVNEDLKLEEMGMNSMMAVEIQQILEDYPDAKLSAKDIRKLTIAEIRELVSKTAV